MIIWLSFAVLATATTAALLHALSSSRARPVRDNSNATRVYRDQLLELDRELTAGRIMPSEYELAKAEIARRLFKAADDITPGGEPPSRINAAVRLSIVAFLPLLSIGMYVALGRPELPSMPLQKRLDNPDRDLAVLVRKTEMHLARYPEDGRGWDVIAPVYLRLNRADDAEKAYRNAIRQLGLNAGRLRGMAEALMAESNGKITEETRQALERSLSIEPNNPRTRFYIALGMEQAGKMVDARAAFEAIVKDSPADAPWLPLLNQHIAMNGGAPAGADQAAPGASAAAPANPTQQDMAAAETMNAGDRQQMIRGMVESLDAKLSEDPNNFEGWVRLVRSYAVLNDKDRAAGALKRGLAAFPPPGEQGSQLLALARELGIAPEGATQ
ncbi:c-type cytochrome biogenesis protein CcmI [Rhizobium ruizarguesonis]|uniref:c-type cytochrome biogenesis protein CcmI n=1 Tax=Rhizobium leguminosarum TaxID=384 RepID=UPI00103F1ADC|nr:c-type cytochrome biogenesis protein CcmI [Rhizobium leguminosarum]MBY5494374.1 c-type cytochrome biogenesis protein CcmI [Rhizobium leguminosarum]TBZ40347.1 c-type cytochrome biogenesis protein CcmI [Rhizobium leguminosarum bv. viciae]TCA19531.1 c-type cytochrome biogenesis protein CcmI [Rhizobium leguminosarum bv. viciae]